MSENDDNIVPGEAGKERKDWRFERCRRLFGGDAMRRLKNSHVAVIGLGGVGSYTVEGLVRTGVGRLTIVDFDEVCVTNINRQIHAESRTVGKSKAELMKDRILAINPRVEIEAYHDFYDRDSSERLLGEGPDLVVDCIDNVTAKMHLIATCIEKSIPIITSLGAAAKVDPTRIMTAPLCDTHSDPLGKALRKFIRRKHGVTNEQMKKVTAVFSDEPVIEPNVDHGGIVCGVDCVCPNGDKGHHTCDQRNVIHGTAVFVTATFGMVAAGAAVQMLLGDNT